MKIQHRIIVLLVLILLSLDQLSFSLMEEMITGIEQYSISFPIELSAGGAWRESIRIKDILMPMIG